MDNSYMQNEWKKAFLTLHEKDTDDQLKNIILKNGSIVNSMPNAMSAANIEECNRLIGEQMACNEILRRRKAEKDSRIAAIEKWKKKDDEKALRKFATMKYSSSANGQLVTAILEEDGEMTSEDIAGWCDELAALDEKSFSDLLCGLVSEGVIESNEGKYALIHICTPDLYDEFPYARGLDILKKVHDSDRELCILILSMLSGIEEPLSAKQIIKKREGYRFLEEKGVFDENECISKEAFEASERQIVSALEKMSTEYKILEHVFMGPDLRTDGMCYYFRRWR